MCPAGLLFFLCVTAGGSAATAPHAAAAPAAVRGAPPAAAADVGTAADWNAAPTNGSPGVDVPKLSGNELLATPTSPPRRICRGRRRSRRPGTARRSLKDGQFCVTVTNKGKDPWDAQARHREMIIQKGHVYSIRYMAHATKPVQMKMKIGMSGPPYKEYWADTVDLTTRPQAFVGVFSMEEDDDATAELAFHFGGAMAGETQTPYTVCFDDIHLDDPKFVKREEDRRRADPERAGQPVRLPAGAAQAGDGQERVEDAAQVGAAQAGRRGRGVGRDASRSAWTRLRATRCTSSISRR